MQAVTTLRSVQTFSGTNARGPWTKTVFKDDSGSEYSTFKGDVASKASALLNIPVTVTYSEKQNGEYTNLTLEDIAAVNGAAPAPPAHAVSAPTGTPNLTPERELRIMRQSGLDRALTAFGISGVDPLQDLGALFELSDSFIDYFENGHS